MSENGGTMKQPFKRKKGKEVKGESRRREEKESNGVCLL